eukprot:UN10434
MSFGALILKEDCCYFTRWWSLVHFRAALFKSIYSNRFKRYEYIPVIWETQHYIKNMMTQNF